MSITCKSLKIENDSLKDQIKALRGDFQNLEKILRGYETATNKGIDHLTLNIQRLLAERQFCPAA